jgi:hypothetical protein
LSRKHYVRATQSLVHSRCVSCIYQMTSNPWKLHVLLPIFNGCLFHWCYIMYPSQYIVHLTSVLTGNIKEKFEWYQNLWNEHFLRLLGRHLSCTNTEYYYYSTFCKMYIFIAPVTQLAAAECIWINNWNI